MTRDRALKTLRFFGAALGVGLITFAVLSDNSLLDWDTYQRIGFIQIYSNNAADTHVFYHFLLRLLTNLGMTPVAGVFLLTSVSVAALVVSAWWVTMARGLTPRGQTACIIWLLSSPGLVSLIISAEDNVAYLAPLLLFLHLVTLEAGDERDERKRALIAGSLLAVAMHINITALIWLAIAPLALVALVAKRLVLAKRLALVFASTLGVYYAMSLLLWPDSPIALHQYFAQAVRLEDFGPTQTPLFSLTRVQQYIGGAQAMLLTPTVYRMQLPSYLHALLDVLLPALTVVGYVALLAWTLRQRDPDKAPGTKLLAGAGLTAVSLLFPFLYEPSLIERWDMAWLCLFIGVITLVARRPRAGMEVVFAFVVLIQVFGTVHLLRNHFGGAHRTRAESDMHELVGELESSAHDPVVLSMGVDRHHLAHLVHSLPGRQWFLVGEDETGALECRAILRPLREVPVPCRDVLAASGRGHAHVDEVAAERLRRAFDE